MKRGVDRYRIGFRYDQARNITNNNFISSEFVSDISKNNEYPTNKGLNNDFTVTLFSFVCMFCCAYVHRAGLR
jgi:hypothetical protein